MILLSATADFFSQIFGVDPELAQKQPIEIWFSWVFNV